jgi:hypothetical protein
MNAPLHDAFSLMSDPKSPGTLPHKDVHTVAYTQSDSTHAHDREQQAYECKQNVFLLVELGMHHTHPLGYQETPGVSCFKECNNESRTTILHSICDRS